MGHKKHRHGPGPIPPANRPKTGPERPIAENEEEIPQHQDNTGFAEQDPKRRLGNYEGAGEHAYVQPGGRNDANRE